MGREDLFWVDKAPHPISISNIIWILSCDTICQLNQLFSKSEAAMLSIPGGKPLYLDPVLHSLWTNTDCGLLCEMVGGPLRICVLLLVTQPPLSLVHKVTAPIRQPTTDKGN